MRPREVLAGRGCRPLQVGHAAGVGLARALAEQGEGVLATAAGGPSGEEGSWARGVDVGRGKERWAAGWAVVLGAGLGFPFLFLFPLSFSFPYSNSTQTISIRIQIQNLNSTTLCTQANKINAPA